MNTVSAIVLAALATTIAIPAPQTAELTAQSLPVPAPVVVVRPQLSPLIAQRQVTFLTADSAEVTSTPDGKVRIFVEGLTDDRGYGVIVTPEGPSNWIEARGSPRRK